MEQSDALTALSALAHETRLSVFRLLVKAGPEGMAAGDIAQRLGVKPNTLSNHLTLLSAAHLVEASRDGRMIHYSANYTAMQQLMQFLIEDCCNGDASICAPLSAVLESCTSCAASNSHTTTQ